MHGHSDRHGQVGRKLDRRPIESDTLLRSIVEAGEWVCFPGGAGSRVYGLPDGDTVTLNGRGTFGSGCRYAEWTAVAFALGDGTTPPRPEDLRFTIVRLDDPGISIEPTWDGMAVRASATDTVHYASVTVPADRCVPWYAANRAEIYRDPTIPMVDERYREDWVGLSDLWLAAMALGTASAALGPSDLIGRLGGEEFAIVLSDADRDGGLAVAERIRISFAEAATDIDGHPISSSVSIGVAACDDGLVDIAALLAQADEALYCAKERGRNRVELASLELMVERAREAMSPRMAAASNAA